MMILLDKASEVSLALSAGRILVNLSIVLKYQHCLFFVFF